jgi:hypothetical protein
MYWPQRVTKGAKILAGNGIGFFVSFVTFCGQLVGFFLTEWTEFTECPEWVWYSVHSVHSVHSV